MPDATSKDSGEENVWATTTQLRNVQSSRILLDGKNARPLSENASRSHASLFARWPGGYRIRLPRTAKNGRVADREEVCALFGIHINQ